MAPTLESKPADAQRQVAPPFPYSSDDGSELPTPSTDIRGVLCSSDGAERGPVGSTACPVCGGDTVDGMGLFSCRDCEWTGVLR